MTAKREVKTWMPAVITAEGEAPIDARVRLHYSADDPYAVHVAITTRRANPVRWVFARDLLILGLCDAAGYGDVIVSPGPDRRTGELLIALQGREATAVVSLHGPSVEKFLGQTYQLVAAGAEADHIDIDETVDQLLAA